MKSASSAFLAALLLVACKEKPDTTPTPAGATPPPTASLASARPVASAAPSAPASPPSASASAAPAAASPCPEGARKNDDAHYCITLPEKRLAVSYEGDSPDQGIREELEIAGDRVVITVDPAKGKTAASMKAAATKRLGSSLADSGDLTDGYWTDAKNEDGGHIIQGVVVSKYVITCTYWVSDEAKLETAGKVCKSLKTF